MILPDIQLRILDLLAHHNALPATAIKRRLQLDHVPTASLRKLRMLDLIDKQDIGDTKLWWSITEHGRDIHKNENFIHNLEKVRQKMPQALTRVTPIWYNSRA